MADLKIEKRTSLPSTPAPDTMYLIKEGSTLKIYVTDDAGVPLQAAGGGGGDEIDPFLLMGVAGD